MIIISHRRNSVEQLVATPVKYGVEIDIRTWKDELILHHDPCVSGEYFVDWLKHYNHQFLILNVKEEGLEERVVQIMRENGINEYFFLDQSFPFLVRTSNRGERRCAVRYSEFESIDTVLSLSGKVDWVWVDCFTHLSLSKRDEEILHDHGYKLCLVSPELQGRDANIEIKEMRQYLANENIIVDAVCTKEMSLWQTES